MAIQIAVFGSERNIPSKVERIAFQVGEEIAKANCVLICGGKLGVMEAVCKGAKSKNGITVGILPFEKDEVNQYTDIKIPTGFGFARNPIVAKSADVAISISGGLGSLTEIAFAIGYGKPIVIIEGTEGISDEIDKLLKIPEIKEKIEICGAKIFKAKNAKEAVRLAVEMALK